jgi:hypothetical protein
VDGCNTFGFLSSFFSRNHLQNNSCFEETENQIKQKCCPRFFCKWCCNVCLELPRKSVESFKTTKKFSCVSRIKCLCNMSCFLHRYDIFYCGLTYSDPLDVLVKWDIFRLRKIRYHHHHLFHSSTALVDLDLLRLRFS